MCDTFYFNSVVQQNNDLSYCWWHFSKRCVITVCRVESFTMTKWKRKPPSWHKMAHIFRLSVMSFFYSFSFLSLFTREKESLMFGRKLQLSAFWRHIFSPCQNSHTLVIAFPWELRPMTPQNIVDLIEQRRKQETDAEHMNLSMPHVSQLWSNALLCGWSIAPLVSETLGNSPRLVQQPTAQR